MKLIRDLGQGGYVDTDSHQFYVGATSTVSYLNHEFFREDPWAGCSPLLLHMHKLEGSACHTVALEHLAYMAGLIKEVSAWPDCPFDHPIPSRWPVVLLHAIKGIETWAEKREVKALDIERPSYCSRRRIAGTVDLKCELTWRKRRVRAVVDLKFVFQLIMAHRIQVRNIYRHFQGFEDCRMGFLVKIDRETGAADDVPLLWGEELHHDTAVIAVSQLRQWGRTYGKAITERDDDL